MKQFWLITSSTTAALGWVALAQSTGQAMDEVATTEFTESAPPQPSMVAPVSVVQPSAPPALKSPAIPIPPVESTVSPAEIAPPPQPVAPVPTSYQPLPPSAYPSPVVVPVTPAATNLPPRSALIEQDPVLQTVIAPNTPEKRATVTNLRPEQVIRDNRSWEELISGSTAAMPAAAPQIKQLPAPVPNPAPNPAAIRATVTPAPPLLNRLERELEDIRFQVLQSVRPVQQIAPVAQPTPTPVPPLTANATLDVFSGEFTPLMATQTTPPSLSAWAGASLGMQFTRYTFSPFALSLSFIKTDLLMRPEALVDQVFGTDAFDSLADQAWFANAAIALQKLALDTTDLSVMADAPFTTTALPLTVFDAQGTIALDFSAFDAMIYGSPLGVNPMTYGFPAVVESMAMRPALK